MVPKKKKPLTSYDLQPGRKIGPHYEVVEHLGRGSEGEVYRIVELTTKIHRAAKLYYHGRMPNGRAAVWYARKLEKLRQCGIVLQYHHTQQIICSGQKVDCVISDFCEGVQLEGWIASQRGGRLPPYVALHVLYNLAKGLESIHGVGEYHADVHSQNILVQPSGVGFNIKLVDFYNWGRPSKEKQQQDILDAVHVFYECLGGRKHYAKLRPEIRYICGALRKELIIRRFPTISALRLHLELFQWQTIP